MGVVPPHRAFVLKEIKEVKIHWHMYKVLVKHRL